MNRFYLLVYLIIIAQAGFGQVANLSPDIKSPNVASLGTFGDIPVSLFTGTPDISIPLIDLKGKDLSLPIVLRYHPGGIKPNQRGGWLGSGWNISLGAIYREVHGQPDEMDCESIPETGYYYRRNLVNNDWYQFGEAPNLSGNDRILHHRGMAYFTDLEADIFHFNVMGLQGSFFLDHNGKWRVQSDHFVSVELDSITPFVDPLTKYAFSATGLVSKSFNKFILKDGYGNRYVFGGINATEYSSVINVGVQEIGGSYQEASGLTLQASSWAIVEIQSANHSEKIEFTYERGPYVTSLYKYAVYNQTYKNSNCNSFGYQSWVTGGGLISPVYPKEVRLNNQKLVFKISTSQELNYEQSDYNNINALPPQDFLSPMSDVINYSTQYVPYYLEHYGGTYYDRIIWMKLDSINYLVNDARNKTVNFEYNNLSTERLFLQTLTQTGQEVNSPYSFSFSYHQKEQMPGYLKSITDHWGFYNGTLFPNPFSPSGTFAQRQADSSFVKKGVLKEIKYPTGGKTVFEFQSGDYSKIVSASDRKSLLTESGIGGIRISKVQTYDGNDKLAQKKEYIYKKDGVNGGSVSSGILNNKPFYYIGTTSGTDMSGGSFSFSAFKSSSINDLTDHAGILIGYSEVTELSGTGDSLNYKTEIFTNHDNGFTDNNPVYNYNANLLANRPVNSRALERGRSLKTIYYNSAKEKVKSITNTYSIGDTAANSGRSLMFNYLDVAVACNVEYYYPSSVSYLNYYYPVTLSGTVDSLFTQVGAVRNAESYEYDPKYKVITKKTSFNSKGDVLVHNYRYTFSFGSGVSNSFSVYDKMIGKSMLNYPIEETARKNGAVVSARVSEYELFGNVLKPSSIYVLEATTPLTSYDSASLLLPLATGGTLNKYDSMKVVQTVLCYDSSGNPLDIKLRDQPEKAYQWGYKGLYPTVEIANAKNTLTTIPTGIKEFFYEGFEEIDAANAVSGSSRSGKKYWNANYTTSFTKPSNRAYVIQWWNLSGDKWIFNEQPFTANITLTGPVDDVRIFPKDAFMTTYTYDPPIGMTSQTYPAGNTTTYEYGNFGRLVLVRDQDKNVLKKYCYNYAGQVEGCSVIYRSAAISASFNRNNCGAGKLGGSVVYTVAEGRYFSTVSQEAADLLAQNDINANGQAYANANGTCTIIKVPVTLKNVGAEGNDHFYVDFIATGGTATTAHFNNVSLDPGDTYTKDVNWGTYNITIESKAGYTMVFSLNGQLKTGSIVTYTNVSITGAFTIYAAAYQNTTQNVTYTRNNCPSGYNPTSVVYVVAAGVYTSLISQADANTQAIAQTASAGQAYANANGLCVTQGPTNTTIVYTNDLPRKVTLTLTNVSTSVVYTFSLSSNTTQGTAGSVPAGYYNVKMHTTGPSDYYSIENYVQSIPDTDLEISNVPLLMPTTTVIAY